MMDNERMEKIKSHQFVQLDRLITTEEFADLICTSAIALTRRIERNPYAFPDKVKVDGQGVGLFILSEVNEWIHRLPVKKYKYKYKD